MSSRLQQEGGAFDGGGGDGGGGDGGGGDGEAEGAFDGGGGDGGSGDADAESEGGGEAAGAHGAECEDDLVDSSKEEEEEEFEEPKDEWSDGLLQYAAAIQKGNLLREPPPPKRQRVDDLPGPNSSEDNMSSCLLQCWRIRHCGFRCTNQASKACTTRLCRKHCLKQNVPCQQCLGKVQVPRFERVRRPGPNYRP